ncbi:hypothetical protein L9O85_03095 [Lawsonibacter asaccharolyticus]|uniref:hypothetical protein n=1 Tax=Lawsonibacter asaccharolyticus TaxID=2108523 RepID=UPI002659AA91|nr:hypothetical protein [Lawsonibacter asaccharolyticus]UMM47421.1 hypothetical protein L9O85_03095 [Lawsonibacter asaccharolyticus]
MKCLIIENGKGYFSIDGDTKTPLDKITKDDLLTILNIIIESDVEMDSYDEAALSHAAHKIIYRNLFEKFKELEKNRARFKDESTSLYRAAIEKYNAELLDENAPFKI